MAPSLKIVAREDGETGPPVRPFHQKTSPLEESGPPVIPFRQASSPLNDKVAAIGDGQPTGLSPSLNLLLETPSPTTGSTSASSSSSSTASKTESASASKTSASERETTRQPTEGPGFPTQTAMIGAIVVIGVIIFGIIAIFFLRRIRRKYKDPKYLPGKTLKNLWIRWEPGYRPPSNPEEANIRRQARSRANIEANRALDRQQSIRSVITLPAYMEQPDEHERVLGREGERDGLDTIVTLPETAEEEETRREERMQAMYELRLQRRAQAAEREARREARRNGTATTTNNTTNRGSTSSVNNSSSNPTTSTEALSTNMANVEAGGSRGRSTSDLTAAILNERQRRISEVNYNDVGVVRSDGSRLRSSSNASNSARDSQPLLGQSAGNGGRSRSGSVLSIDTTGEGRQSEDRGTDLGSQRLPPSYDGLDWGDAPPYMSPVTPVSRQGTGGLNRNSSTTGGGGQQSPENTTSMRLPVVRVIGASNPNSPLEESHPR